MGIPYTHSGVLASAVAMDKPSAKRVFAAAGVRVPKGVLATRADLAAGDPMARPYVIKPVAEGSTVGVTHHRASAATRRSSATTGTSASTRWSRNTSPAAS